MAPGFTLNQLAWQVGSIREVCDAIAWLKTANVDLVRVGRDQPGGNWHVYSFDPDRYVNEMFYGLEQIGWDHRSKPLAVYSAQMNPPDLPIIPEYQEVADAACRGVNPSSGHRYDAMGTPRFDVDGVLMPRPFKIVRTGPVRLFTSDLDRSLRYYTELLGLAVTEEITYRGHRCVFLRCNTEHHALALYPIELRALLGIETQSPVFSIGLQVATYDQLRAAIAFLQESGVTIRHLPPELSPGIDYTAFAFDPEGNAFQLYYYMEQVGWDGRPRPSASRLMPTAGPWPQTVPGREDSYSGEIFQGPWA
jgi:catechol 2,3-dioxygenase-like lactoylglutathione lyase family enzyme